MKKKISIFLCFVMLFSLCSCVRIQISGPHQGLNTDNTSASSSTASNVEPPIQNEASPSVIDQRTYYKITRLHSSTVRYEIFDLNGNCVLTEETDRPLKISLAESHLLDICIEMETGISCHRYYDVKNNRFSKEYSNVVARSSEIVVFLSGSLEQRVLVAESTFDNSLRKEFFPELAPTQSPITSATLSRGVLYLTYETGHDSPIRKTALPLFEANYDYFSSYEAIAELFTELYRITRHFEDPMDYGKLLGITNAEQRAVFEALLASMLSFFPPNADARIYTCYALRDLNDDGIFELIALTERRDVIAIFTLVNGKPQLLDRYHSGRRGAVDHNGTVYAYGGNGADSSSSCAFYQLSENGERLELLEQFGTDGCEWINGEAIQRYFKMEKGEKRPITEQEYQALAKQYPIPSYTLFERAMKPILYHPFQLREADARHAILAVLEGRAKVYDPINGTARSLTDCKVPGTQMLLSDVPQLGYALIDLDSNGANELVINCGSKLILRYCDGKVYLYEFPIQNISRIYTNGTCDWDHGGTEPQYGKVRLSFDGTKLSYRELYRAVNDGEPNAEYYVQGNRVSREELQAYLAGQSETELTFIPLALPWSVQLTPEEARAIANAYWGDVEGRTTGAAGSTLKYRVLLRNDPCWDDIRFYHFELMAELYSNEDGVLYDLSQCKRILVDVFTGDCVVYQATIPDGK